jgi:hypothetical protein
MKLTIIPVDGTVNKEGKAYIGLNLISCEIPTDVHALQWEEHEPNKGYIEFKSSLVQNQEITQLPVWANVCLTKWDEAKAAEEAAIESAKKVAQLNDGGENG